MTHEELRDALPLHALGLLDAAERQTLQSHLESCGACTTELAELCDTASSLALLPTPIDPSAERLGRILDALPPREATRRRWRPAAIGAGLAAAAVIAFLLFSQVVLVRRLDEAYAQIDRMREIAQFVTSPEVSLVPLWGTEGARGAHAKLAYHRESGRFMLFSSRMPQAPPGKKYQLWVITDRVRPAAAFSAESPDGTLPTPPKGGEAFFFGVSIEPSDDVAEPTGGMVMMSAPQRAAD